MLLSDLELAHLHLDGVELIQDHDARNRNFERARMLYAGAASCGLIDVLGAEDVAKLRESLAAVEKRLLDPRLLECAPRRG